MIITSIRANRMKELNGSVPQNLFPRPTWNFFESSAKISMNHSTEWKSKVFHLRKLLLVAEDGEVKKGCSRPSSMNFLTSSNQFLKKTSSGWINFHFWFRSRIRWSVPQNKNMIYFITFELIFSSSISFRTSPTYLHVLPFL